MPKQRFYNLPSDKKERILNSAIKEFSRVPVNEVSINKIIKEANISRGSFYQYFEDKNDLIREIMSGYKNTIIENIKTHIQNRDINIFDLSIEILENTIDFVNNTNNQGLCFYIFDNMRNNEDFFHKIIGVEELNTIIDMLISLIDISTFKYSDREDIINVFEIVSAMGCKTIMKVIKQPQNRKAFIDGFKRQLVIIKTGILI